MSEKLTKRQLHSLEKQFENKEQRADLKARKAERRSERALRERPPPRRREWLEEDDAPVDRRPKVKPAPRPAADLEQEATAGPLATVIEVLSSESLVTYEGHTLRATLPPNARQVAGMRSPIAVGDRVQIEPAGTGQARIVAVAPRESALVRDVFDPSRRGQPSTGQVVAANIDQVLIVCSPSEPPFRPGLIDRYLVAASRDALPATICLNKIDLGVPRDVEAALTGYERLGVRTVRVSATTGEGCDDVRRAIEGKISVLAGHSGVGKSSLLNAIEPGLHLRAGEVARATAGQGKGRHTTSSVRLVPLSPPETFVVDTPGIRAFGIRGIDPRELASHFADIAALAQECSYADCLHRGEPACAVAVEANNDAFLRGRLATYRGMLGEMS